MVGEDRFLVGARNDRGFFIPPAETVFKGLFFGEGEKLLGGGFVVSKGGKMGGEKFTEA